MEYIQKMGMGLQKVGVGIYGRLMALLLVLAVFGMNAQAAFVEVDGTTGEITFTPGDVLDPVITAVVAAVVAAVALFVIFVGTRYVYRALKTGK